MIAGATWGWWIGFHAVVAVFLIVDSLYADRLRKSPRAVWLVPTLVVVAALAMALWIGLSRGRTSGLEFLAG